MKVAIYTLTRDRLDYTKHCFGRFREKAGYPYDHFVVDNYSVDGTREWLKTQEFKEVLLLDENKGISRGSNLAVDMIIRGDYDLIIKMDNDCEVVSNKILSRVVSLYEGIKPFDKNYVLSPYVHGIKKQPIRARHFGLSGFRIGITAIVGGLFHIVQRKVYEGYRYPETLPLAWGQDDDFCGWVKDNGGNVGYIEGLEVNHYETTAGQAQRYPDYFERKWKEERK